jgi:hypothetical protein
MNQEELMNDFANEFASKLKVEPFAEKTEIHLPHKEI